MAVSTTRWVLFDDTHASIQYHGPWYERSTVFDDYESAWLGPYGDSQHGTNGSASLSFAYNGTRIRVLGTSLGNATDPTWDCFLDGKKFPPEKPATRPWNNWALCEGPGDIAEGNHVFTLNVTSNGTPFWIDQIRFLPSPDARLDHPAVFIEENDTAVNYLNGRWYPVGNYGVMTSQAGATMQIEFSGTKATWIGQLQADMPSGTSRGAYTVDDDEWVKFAIPGVSPGKPSEVHRLFVVDDLDAGEHVLKVRYDGTSAPLSFHYLLVEDGDINSPRLPADSSYSTPINTQPSPSSSSPPGGSSDLATANHTGAIIGGVLGGLAIISLTLLFLLFIKNRTAEQPPSVQKSANLDKELLLGSGEAKITPFYIIPDSTGASLASVQPMESRQSMGGSRSSSEQRDSVDAPLLSGRSTEYDPPLKSPLVLLRYNEGNATRPSGSSFVEVPPSYVP